jgi:hypothetical protein
MKLKKIVKKVQDFRKKVNDKLMIKGYRIKFKYMMEKDPTLQNGNRFFSRKKK